MQYLYTVQSTACKNLTFLRCASRRGCRTCSRQCGQCHAKSKNKQKSPTPDIGPNFDMRPTLFVWKNFKNKTKNGSNC